MISSVPGIVSLSGGWLSLLEEVEDDETGDSAQEFSAKLTEEGVANRRSRQSVAVTAIVNIFFMAEYPFLLMSLSYST